MKKTYITLFALLSMMAFSCQKENFTEVQPAAASEASAYTLRYTVDGTTYHATFQTNAERLSFIRHLVALAREGHSVRIGNTAGINASKEVVTFTTTSSDEAASWAADMESQGYVVDITYDKKKGIYICTATR